MDFDLSKENIQPLRGGRNASQLGAALQAQSDIEYQKELMQQKEAFESAINNYEGPDPLENWYNYISWIEQSYPKHGHEGHLSELLECCLGKFEHDTRYIQDRRLCKLWIKYIDLQQNPLELFQLLYSKGIGTQCTDLYRAWAYYHEAAEDFKRADRVFQLGFQANAQPQDELHYAHQNFTLAVGRHVIRGWADMEQLAEQRQTLTSLRPYHLKNRAVVGSQRTGDSVRYPTPGAMFKAQSVRQQPGASNAPVQIFEDASEYPIGASTSAAQPQSILESASRREVHKENTLKAGPWTGLQPKKPLLPPNAHSNLQFTVHEDSPQKQEAFKYPPNFVSFNKDDFSDFKVQTFLPVPEDPKKIPQYNKKEVYCNNTEYSFEEIRAKKWYEKQKVKQSQQINQNSPHVHSQNIYVMNKTNLNQTNNSIHPQSPQQGMIPIQGHSVGYTPLKARLNELKVSSPLGPDGNQSPHLANGNQIINRSVANLTNVFNNTAPLNAGQQPVNSYATLAESHRNSPLNVSRSANTNNVVISSQNSAEEVAKAVESIQTPTKGNWSEYGTFLGGDATKEVRDMWGGSSNTPSCSIVEIPRRTAVLPTNFQIHEDDTQSFMPPQPNIAQAVPFPIYSEEEAFQNNDLRQNYIEAPTYSTNEMGSGFKVKNNSVTYSPNQHSYGQPNMGTIPDVVSNAQSPQMNYPPVTQQPNNVVYSNVSPNIQPNMTANFEEPCSTQMFNFNINKASTPHNNYKKMQSRQSPNYQNISLYYNEGDKPETGVYEHSAKQNLFPAECHYKEAPTNQPPTTPNTYVMSQSNYNQTPPSVTSSDCYELKPVESEQRHESNKLLSVILETTEYRSGSSSSSGGATTMKTFAATTGGQDNLPVIEEVSHSSRETCGMEYEIGQAMLQLSRPQQAFKAYDEDSQHAGAAQSTQRVTNVMRHPYDEMSVDQNSKQSVETVQTGTSSNDAQYQISSSRSSEIMEWDEYSNTSMDNDACIQNLSAILASDKPVDPFERKVIDCLLKKVRFPNARHIDRYERVQSVQKPTLKETLVFRNEKYLVEKVLGKGTFGTVVKGTNLNDGTAVALKYQKPPNYWEYYICREIQHRIKDSDLLLSFMDVRKAYFGKNACLLVSEFSKHGSLLNVANQVKKTTGKQMKEIVIFHFVNEILRIVGALHQCQIIHADIKPDNFLVMCMPPDSNRLSVQLIDFGCSIDMSLFPSNMQFYKVIQTEDFTCHEMKESRSWTYQTDLYCMAATAYVLLIGEYMQTQKRGELWTLTKRLPRYLSQDVWNSFFTQLLNIESCDRLPDLIALQSTFQSLVREKCSQLQGELRNIANILNGR